MKTRINWLATGTLLGFLPCHEREQRDGADMHIVIVDKGGYQNYVVSTYYDGDTSWIQGHYFEHLADAVTKATEMAKRYQ